MTNKIYQGILSFRQWADEYEILFLSSLRRPLAEELSWMAGKKVTVRYWITDKQCTKEDACEAHMMTVMGCADVNLEAHYSEITGYLWTDEYLNIGGHDLLDELKSNIGKWLILEVEEH